MSLKNVLETARGELGVCEEPAGSNLTKYGFWFGLNGVPWCVIFLCWLYNKAGEKAAFFGGAKTASCGTLLKWYREQGQTVTVEQVQPGDIVILNFSGTKETQHCGLAADVGLKNGVYTVTTIEGNTSPGLEGSQDNGGCVALKERYIRQIIGVCRPQYKEEEMPKDDITGHWAEEAIRRCMKRKIITGFPDGTFRPNETITRAEAATMIDRLVQLLIGEDDGK